MFVRILLLPRLGQLTSKPTRPSRARLHALPAVDAQPAGEGLEILRLDAVGDVTRQNTAHSDYYGCMCAY